VTVEKYIRDALILWATIDPISTLALFASISSGLPRRQQSRIALRACLFAAAVLIGSMILGQLILAGMGISMVAFQVAGGAILFVFALQLVFGNVPRSQTSPSGTDGDPAVFPLAIPSIASPGAIMAVIVLTDNHLYSVPVQAGTAAIALAILLITYALMSGAARALSIIRPQGAEMLVRVMGLLLAALSVQLVLDALGLSHALLS